MADFGLDEFLTDAEAAAKRHAVPSDIVQILAPKMHALLRTGVGFLRPEHYRSNPEHYARNLVHAAGDDGLSLFTLVWEPGQWTPVHDHGTWGVVGVVEGVLEERAYMRTDADPHADRDDGIALQRGGIVFLPPAAVSTFVPNPDHIHVTGVATDRQRCVSLHLYGRNLNSFFIYDVGAGTRRRIDVGHTET